MYEAVRITDCEVSLKPKDGDFSQTIFYDEIAKCKILLISQEHANIASAKYSALNNFENITGTLWNPGEIDDTCKIF